MPIQQYFSYIMATIS